MLTALEIGMVIVGLGVALRLVRLPKAGQASLVTATCLAVVLVGFTQPAVAGAVNGDALTGGQKDLNETLQTTPQGNQYQGIEYADAKGTPLGDQEITDRVKGKVPNELKVSVSNGSVRLSGKVADRGTAQAIVDDIKAIPGVHEVAYDLGLKR
ncbi:BON domain-containing protein [Leptolyngbya sp. KIOST-1]|uniref:BON domain-containing protein n=1 Tax=Leptolyngbya sp. KIOST-1 TaxID=1229172 RepID=UPI0009DCE3D0|nr:BON domain-containing protein [Leptolyngbya sp. KIOST-1]